MKKNLRFILVFIAVVAIGFTGCKKDDKGTNSLVGKWELVSQSTKYKVNGQWGQPEIDTEAVGLILEFKSDKTFTMFDFLTGTYSTSGDKLTMTIFGVGMDNKFTISGDTLTIVYAGDDDGVVYEETTVYKKK